MEESELLVLKITEDGEGKYNFTCGAGMSVAEVEFCIAMLAKVLVRDKYLKSTSEFLKGIKKYVNHPGMTEVEETNDGQDTSEDNKS